MEKTYLVKTYGCQANSADSNTLRGILDALDFTEVVLPVAPNEDTALQQALAHTDLFIINTCSIRQKSEDKVYGLGKVLKKVQENTGKKPFVVMAGCMVGSVTGERQRYALEELKKKTKWVDAYMNPSQLMQLPVILKEHNVLTDWAMQKFDASTVLSKPDSPVNAFVNISNGCDNFCTFCVVPYARGREVSRSQDDILREINHFVARGVSEITLCGQNVNSWGLDMSEKFNIRTGSDHKLPFASLLRKVHAIEGVSKISFLSSNPFDFTTDLIEAVALPKVSNYIHIAVQSGNNEVLKKMNRRHTVEDFIALVEKLKQVKPDMELGTDIIVGFPSETRDQFLDTVKLFEKVKFNVAFISIYSPRKGTPAEKFYPDDVTREEKKWRHAHLTSVWNGTKR